VEFDPRPAVLQWLTSQKRRENDTAKATQQDWFRQAFDVYADDCGESCCQKILILTRLFNDGCIECIH